MTQILIVTTDKDKFADFTPGLNLSERSMHWASTGAEALALVKDSPVDLVIADEQLGDMPGLAFVEQLVKVNPMINTAAISTLSKADYHEASEGLGVLMQLPARPGQDDGKALMAYLNKILGFTQAAED